jgi:hypothetical protein
MWAIVNMLTVEERRSSMKSPIASKLNWLGTILLLAGLLQDPTVVQMLGELIPPWLLPKILAMGGLLVIIIRTGWTNQPVGREDKND